MPCMTVTVDIIVRKWRMGAVADANVNGCREGWIKNK